MNHTANLDKTATPPTFSQIVNSSIRSSFEQSSKHTTHYGEANTHSGFVENESQMYDKDVGLYSIFFLEKKKNIIMDGFFSKIIYSNQFFTMNGMYLSIPIYSKCSSSSSGYADYTLTSTAPTILKDYPYVLASEINRSIFERLCYIEKNILDQYSATYIRDLKTKIPIYSLKTQLCSGYVKTTSRDGGTSLTNEHLLPKMHVKTAPDFFTEHASQPYKKSRVLNAVLRISSFDQGSTEFRSNDSSNTLSEDGITNIPSTLHTRRYSPTESVTGSHIYVKISGVWETETTFGITFKFMTE